jgi:pyruvate dehydrogenase E2 component (dihydrolipoamide acetyltransferase)
MPTEVILPKVDMDMATGRISRWFAEQGATVAKGAVLFEIETDKAAMEIEAPASGVLVRAAGTEDADIPVGQAVAWIYGAGETPQFDAAPAAPAGERPPATDPGPGPERSCAAVSTCTPTPGRTVAATPLARRLAQARGIDLSRVTGSGPRDTRVTAVAAPLEASLRAGSPVPAGATWLRQEGGGPPLVLIHGFGAETASWRPFLTAFRRAMPIVSIDLPGHGAAVDVPAAQFDDLVAHVEAQLQALGIGVAHLAGHSLGGAVAAAVAAGVMVEARSLFLIAPAGLGPEINTGFTEGFAAASDEAALRVWMRELVHDPEALSDAFVKAAARARADGRQAQAQLRLVRGLFAEGTQRFSVRGALGRQAIPVKVVAGTADRIIPARHAQGLPGQIALHLFDGIGHMPQLENRAAVAALLDQLV